MDAAVFGRFLAETRRAQDLTQAELAGRIGVTDKAVSRWERGVGFPDIQTLEPLAAALGLTVPELMRSRREEAPQPLSDRDVTELLQSAVTMARENQRQDRTATLLAILVTVLAGTPVFLTRHANLGGAYFFGAVAAMAAVGAYLYLRNREDRASRRIYGCFLLAGTGLTLALLLTMGVPAPSLWRPSPWSGSGRSATDPKRNAPASFRTPGRSQCKASRADAQPLYWL